MQWRRMEWLFQALEEVGGGNSGRESLKERRELEKRRCHSGSSSYKRKSDDPPTLSSAPAMCLF